MTDLQTPRQRKRSTGFVCKVNYDIPLKERIVENGITCLNRKCLNSFLKYRPKTAVRNGVRLVKIKLFKPRKRFDTKAVLREIKKRGGRPAIVEEVLTLRLAHPTSLTVSIVGLGSICNKPPLLPLTFRWAGKWRLGFTDPEDEWGASDQFAYIQD